MAQPTTKEMVAEVRERFPEVKFPDVIQEPLYAGRGANLRPIEGYSSVTGYMQEEEPIIYAAAVSEQYKLVRHEVAIWHLLQALEQNFKQWGPAKIHPYVFKEGARLRVTLKFTDRQEEVQPGDIIQVQAGLDNSYDLSCEFGRHYGGERLVCSNGMTAYDVVEKDRKKHRQNLDVEDQIQALSQGMEGFHQQIEEWHKWGEQEIDPASADAVLDEVPFGKRHREQILALPEKLTGIKLEDYFEDKKPVNVWTFNNILTQFLTHDIESDMVRVEKTTKVAKVFSRHFTQGKPIKVAA